MRIFKKLFYLNVLLLALSTLFFFRSNQVIASEKITFHIHKTIYVDGGVSEGEDELLHPFKGINGVTFTAYDVSKTFYQLKETGASDAKALEMITSNVTGEKVATKITATIGDNPGVATFVLPKKVNQRDAVYAFVETNQPEAYKNSPAAPLVKKLPLTDRQGQELSEVEIYLKNQELHPEVPPLKKEVSEKISSVEIGSIIPYTITTKIPRNIQKATDFTIQDKASENLWLNTKSLKVTFDGESVTTGVHVTNFKHGFRLNFDEALLKEREDSQVVVSYTMTLQGNVNQGEQENTASLIYNNHPTILSHAKVVTGGKDFLKVDGKNTKKTLAGATFVIQNDTGEYLKQDQKKNHWLKISGDIKNHLDEVTLLTSNDSGSFQVTGLAYGDYFLKEVKAPKGYIGNNSQIAFSVNGVSFPGQGTVPLKIVNEQGNNIFKRPHGRLPQTGELIGGVSLLGLALLLTAIAMYKIKERRNGERQ